MRGARARRLLRRGVAVPRRGRRAAGWGGGGGVTGLAGAGAADGAREGACVLVLEDGEVAEDALLAEDAEGDEEAEREEDACCGYEEPEPLEGARVLEEGKVYGLGVLLAVEADAEVRPVVLGVPLPGRVARQAHGVRHRRVHDDSDGPRVPDGLEAAAREARADQKRGGQQQRLGLPRADRPRVHGADDRAPVVEERELLDHHELLPLGLDQDPRRGHHAVLRLVLGVAAGEGRDIDPQGAVVVDGAPADGVVRQGEVDVEGLGRGVHFPDAQELEPRPPLVRDVRDVELEEGRELVHNLYLGFNFGEADVGPPKRLDVDAVVVRVVGPQEADGGAEIVPTVGTPTVPRELLGAKENFLTVYPKKIYEKSFLFLFFFIVVFYFL